MRFNDIAKAEGMTIEPKVLGKIVIKHFPDLRSTITFLQGMYEEGKRTVTVGVESTKIGNVIVEVADYTYKSNFVIDKFVTLSACLQKIKKALNE